MPTKCPHCGYCQSCGRSNAYPFNPQPWFPYTITYYGNQPLQGNTMYAEQNVQMSGGYNA